VGGGEYKLSSLLGPEQVPTRFNFLGLEGSLKGPNFSLTLKMEKKGGGGDPGTMRIPQKERGRYGRTTAYLMHFLYVDKKEK